MKGPAVSDDPGSGSPAQWILAIARDGDRVAFAHLFNLFGPRLKGFVMRQGLSAAAAEELVQDAMLAVWRKAGSFDPQRASAATWIFTIARNLRIDLQRRTRSQVLPSLIDEAEAAGGEEIYMAAQDRALVHEALARLNEEQRRIVELSYFHEEPQSEIARSLGIPLGTVKSRIRLALARLRSFLDDQA